MDWFYKFLLFVCIRISYYAEKKIHKNVNWSRGNDYLYEKQIQILKEIKNNSCEKCMYLLKTVTSDPQVGELEISWKCGKYDLSLQCKSSLACAVRRPKFCSYAKNK